MSKAVYGAVGSAGRKGKKLYGALDGVARKVKKAYIGVNGIARQFYTAEQKIKKLGSVLELSHGARGPAAVTFNNLALFMGGYYAVGTTVTNLKSVDAFDVNLTRSSPTTMLTAQTNASSETVGEYALVAGGQYYSSGQWMVRNTVDAFDAEFTHISPAAMSGTGYNLPSGTVGNYAVFIGTGTNNDGLNAYDADLTRKTKTLSLLSGGYYGAAAAPFNNYAVIADANVVNAIDENLTELALTTLSVSRSRGFMSLARAKGYLLVAGGEDPGLNYATSAVEAFDAEMTRTTVTGLSVARMNMCSAELEGFALFCGGTKHVSTSTLTNLVANVDAYDENLTRTRPGDLSVTGIHGKSTTLGDYAFVAGVSTNTSVYDADVDVYTLE